MGALSPVDFWTGIVGDVYEVPRMPDDPSVFVSVSRVADFSAIGLPATATNAGSGAGLTYEAAWAAAVGESVERYAAAIVQPEELRVAGARELSEEGETYMPPGSWTLPLDEDLLGHGPLVPFDDEIRVGWVPADDLVHRRRVWVPACLIYMPYVLREPGESLIGHGISTGLACGGTRRDALLGGLCEILERDAFVITWRTMRPAPRVTFGEGTPMAELFARRFARPGLDYRLFHTTLDVPVPSFFGFVRDRRRDPPAVVAGGAAHPLPEVAVQKTLLELAQGLAWVHNPGRRTTPVIDDFGSVRSFDDHMRLYADAAPPDAFAFLEDNAETVMLEDIEPLAGGDRLHEAISACRDAGIDVLAVDLTSADVAECGLHVVKVMAPQCEVLEPNHRLPYLSGARWRRFHQPGAPLNPFPHPYP